MERTNAIAEHDLVIILLEDSEVAPDAPLKVNQDVRNLLTAELWLIQRQLILPMNFLTDLLANNADKTCSILDPDNFFQRPRQFTKHHPKERIPPQKDR